MRTCLTTLTMKIFSLCPNRIFFVETYDYDLLPLGHRTCVGIPTFSLLKKVRVSHSHKRCYCCSLHISYREGILLSPQGQSDSLKPALRTNLQRQEKACALLPILYSIYWQQQVVSALVSQFCSAAPISGLPHHSVLCRALSISGRNVFFQPTPGYWRRTWGTLLPQSKGAIEQYSHSET